MEPVKLGEFEVPPLYFSRSMSSLTKKVCKKQGCQNKLGKRNTTGYCKFHYLRTGRKPNPRSLAKEGSLFHVKSVTRGAD